MQLHCVGCPRGIPGNVARTLLLISKSGTTRTTPEWHTGGLLGWGAGCHSSSDLDLLRPLLSPSDVYEIEKKKKSKLSFHFQVTK
jgi:hypothetical protein